MGDPAGIGLEITLKLWRERNALSVPAFVLYADPAALRETAARLGAPCDIAELANLADAASAFPTHLPVRPVPLATRAVPGRPTSTNGAAVVQAINLATAAVIRGEAAAIVTNPIAKHVLYEAGFTHPGHTEYLAALADRAFPGDAPHHPVMMLACDELRVVPLTVHVPISMVPALVTAEALITTARITHRALRRDFGFASPRLVVAGLNPHAGEAGTIGLEDCDVIAPAIKALQTEGLDIRGPLSADTLFHAAARQQYDAAICMYHDQALIPIKTLAFDSGVNVTLGLPFVRTSPDHGTAFDIADRGIASASSLMAALRMAHQMASRRAQAGR